MKRYLFLSVLLGSVFVATAQLERPFLGMTGTVDKQLLKKDGNGRYYRCGADFKFICFFSNTNYYKLFDASNKLLEEGQAMLNGVNNFVRTGKWKEYYTNGKLKTIGYYYADKPIDNWQTYYENGKLESRYSFGTLTDHNGDIYTAYSGLYEEYFKNGKVKVSGMYAVGTNPNSVDTTEVYDPVTNTTKLITEKHQGYSAIKIGTWKYYTVDGSLARKEENH